MPGRAAKPLVLGVVVGLALLLTVSASAGAAVRFAAPGGTGGAPCTNGGAPCSLFTANGQAAAGDEVVLAPGEYTDLSGDLGPQGAIAVATGVHLRGAAGQPRPLISIEDPVSPNAIFVFFGGLLSRVEIRTETASRNVVVEGEAKDILATSRTEGPNTLVCDVRQGVLRDSVCIAERPFAAAAGVAMGASVQSFNATFRNVTAVGGIGLKFEVNGDAQYTATVSSTIAKGGAEDIAVSGLSPDPHTPGTGAQVRVNLDHSSYATASTETDAGNGVATATPAGSATNIAAPAQLRPDGYHQVKTSPTVNAGALDPDQTVDVDGQQRTIGGSPDIGADELASPTEISVTCDPKVLVTGSGVAHCTAFVGDLSAIEGTPTGAPSVPQGTLSFATKAPGSFSNGGVCALGPSVLPNQASCRIDYTPTAVTGSPHDYTAFYGGDAVHDASTQPGFFNVNGLGEGSGGGSEGGGNGKPGPTSGVAPATALTKKPPKRTSKRIARFQFVSDQPGSSFECKLDRRPYKACSSPFKAKALKPGRHTFMVRAKNSAGMSDSTPAVHRWRVRPGHPRTQP